jgi:hypothetical protein
LTVDSIELPESWGLPFQRGCQCEGPLGLTGWAGLCRLVRAETLKQRELAYVRAAQAFGVGHARIMWRHIFPNVAHLMLIVTVLEVSASSSTRPCCPTWAWAWTRP